MSGVNSVIANMVRKREPGDICVTGAHGIVEAHDSQSVYSAHKEASLVVPDGMPLVWIGRLSGRSETDRIYGPDLMLSICRQAEEMNWRVFLYGTTTNTLFKLTARLKSKFPELAIVGHLAPPFRALTQREKKDVISKINAAHPDILFIGLSTPKQEQWMHEFSKRMDPMVMIGAGAAFDFIAGTKRQAPQWIRQSGFEWAFRLSMEPTRLLKRYAVTNTRFLRYASLYLWRMYTGRKQRFP